jgi:glycolate oxidase FAD binding subunit
MTEALQSPADPSAAAHLPANVSARSGITAVASARGAVTALRVEGPPPSVAARRGELRSLLAPFGDLSELKRADSIAFWQNVRDVSFFAADPETVVWRLSIPPADGARVVERILRDREGAAFYDWGGGLVWLALPAAEDGNQAIVRGSVALTGGHATLIRAPEAVRRMGEVFQPQAPALALLTRRIKEAFDPKRILNRGRMYAGV